jgi:hypothetical protein
MLFIIIYSRAKAPGYGPRKPGPTRWWSQDESVLRTAANNRLLTVWFIGRMGSR